MRELPRANVNENFYLWFNFEEKEEYYATPLYLYNVSRERIKPNDETRLCLKLEKDISRTKLNKKKEIRGVSLITGILVFILIFSIYKMLILSNLDIKLYEIPVLEILNGFTMTEKILYEIAIVAAIFTSEISAGFGILENIREKEKYKIVALIMCVLGIPISYIGFGRLVEVLYPVFGIIGLLQIILIVAFRAKVNYK